MNTKLLINSNQSDVLIQGNQSVITYMGGHKNQFSGYVVMDKDTLEDASLVFSLDLHTNHGKKESLPFFSKMSSFFRENDAPVMQFKSTSFQKINKNINFLKGDLTIKNVTKTLELEAKFMGMNNYDGLQKGAFKVSTKINRLDFDNWYNSNFQQSNVSIGRDIKLVANLEFLM
ncbi:MAG: YceI family protein [Flavobacterium sp.]